MAKIYRESNLEFEFDKHWDVIQFDSSVWYRNHFQSCAESAAVDFIAVNSQESTAWLLEVKDFTSNDPLRSKDLIEIITKKVRDTLAGIVAGAKNANERAEQSIFSQLLEVGSLRVAFHCERPKHKSRLFKNLPDLPDLRTKLRQTLRAIDKRTHVVDSLTPNDEAPWTARWKP